MQPIGFYDSGVGGLSVLKCAVKLLPNEDYFYFADTFNAPYGTKTVDQVMGFAFQACEKLVSNGAKAIVIACNTATSAAAKELRSSLDIPIIGMEPALKPAAMIRNKGKILVLATPLTLSLPKFRDLMALYGHEDTVSVPCPGLMEFVERGITSGEEIEAHIKKLIKPYLSEQIDAVVLGCTHYVFLRETISRIFPKETAIIDGNEGTIRQLERKLREYGLQAATDHIGNVTLTTSLQQDDTLTLMQHLLWNK